MARHSSVRSGWVVDSPFFNRGTCSVRPSFKIDVRQLKPQGFRHAQPVAEHQQEQAAVAGLVAGSLGGCDELFHFAGG